jgi:hypothetical protein
MNTVKKPLLSVAKKPTMVRKSLGIQSDILERLEDYAAFLGTFAKGQVKVADVIGTLSERLEKDALFTKWRAERESKPAAVPKAVAK